MIKTNNITKLIIDGPYIEIDKKIDDIYINRSIRPNLLSRFLENFKLQILYLPNKFSFMSYNISSDINDSNNKLDEKYYNKFYNNSVVNFLDKYTVLVSLENLKIN